MSPDNANERKRKGPLGVELPSLRVLVASLVKGVGQIIAPVFLKEHAVEIFNLTQWGVIDGKAFTGPAKGDFICTVLRLFGAIAYII